jgi:hypothetical protein
MNKRNAFVSFFLSSLDGGCLGLPSNCVQAALDAIG